MEIGTRLVIQPTIEYPWATFCSKTSVPDFYQKNYESILSLYVSVTSRQKTFHAMILQKTSTYLFCPKTFAKTLGKGFPKKSSCSILSLYAAVTSSKKSKKFYILTFNNDWKISFWAYFGPVFIVFSYPQSPQTNLFPMLFICPPKAEKLPKPHPTQPLDIPANTFYSVPFLKFWTETGHIKKNPIIKPWKYRSRQLLTAIIIYFLSPLNTFKKKTSSTWNPQPLRHTVQRVIFYYGPISGSFWPKYFKIRFFPKTLFSSIFSLYITVLLCKKLEKVWLKILILILIKLDKLHFEPHFVRKAQNKIFPKNKTWKTSFSPQNPRTGFSFFFENRAARSLFKLVS